MVPYESQNSGMGLFGWMFLILLVLVAIVFVLPQADKFQIDVATNHAEQQHGQEAISIRDCLKQNGAVLSLRNPVTGRYADVCQFPSGAYGLQITNSAGEEITAFLKQKARNVEDVLRYLLNRGYGQ